MFSFFQRKNYLVDHLHGFVDIHNHILPGIDDGAKTVEKSMDLIHGFSELGITHFICTPHIMHNYYDNTPETIKKAYTRLRSALESNGGPEIKIDYAAEHMIDDNFEHILETGNVLPMGKEYLLVEMSYLQPSYNFDFAIESIAGKAYFPILAHPERYMYYHGKQRKYESLKSNGVLFQLNLLSLSTKSYGPAVYKTAEKLLNEGMIDFIGSDVHNSKQLALLKELKISKKSLELLFPIIENTIQTFY